MGGYFTDKGETVKLAMQATSENYTLPMQVNTDLIFIDLPLIAMKEAGKIACLTEGKQKVLDSI